MEHHRSPQLDLLLIILVLSHTRHLLKPPESNQERRVRQLATGDLRCGAYLSGLRGVERCHVPGVKEGLKLGGAFLWHHETKVNRLQSYSYMKNPLSDVGFRLRSR